MIRSERGESSAGKQASRSSLLRAALPTKFRNRPVWPRVSTAILLGLMLSSVWADSDSSLATGSLADLSLQELADLEITSLGKKPTPLSQAPASLYVITNKDIRRSGATTLPEALRLSPRLTPINMPSAPAA